jgi:hypothetical protein
MKYSDLMLIFAEFHVGLLSKAELGLAIGLWQRGGARI